MNVVISSFYFFYFLYVLILPPQWYQWFFQKRPVWVMFGLNNQMWNPQFQLLGSFSKSQGSSTAAPGGLYLQQGAKDNFPKRREFSFAEACTCFQFPLGAVVLLSGWQTGLYCIDSGDVLWLMMSGLLGPCCLVVKFYICIYLYMHI